MSIYWPIALAVCADIFYQICAKSTPESLNPLAGLTITYMVGAAVSAVLFFALNKGESIVQSWSHINWTTFVLGIAIVGLEVGAIYMYKVGWNINTGFMVKAIILSLALILVGYFIYREQITTTKVCGMAVCLLGLYLINK